LGKVVRKAPPPPDAVDLYDESVVSFELKPPATAAGAKKAAKKSAAKKTTFRGGMRGGDLPGDATTSDGAVGGGALESKGAIVPAEAVFGLESVERAAKTTATLRLKASQTPHTQIEVLSLKTGEVLKSAGDFQQEVPPGEYVVKLRERGVTVSRREVTLKPGEEKTLELIARPTDKVRDTILKAVHADDAGGASVFSESSLGPLANTDLGLWLSLFGASRILGEPGQFRKLERLPPASA
jgi:hypothetical protein